jgi:hypothetical protein
MFLRDRCRPVDGRDDLEPFPSEIAAHELDQRRLVIDDEDALGPEYLHALKVGGQKPSWRANASSDCGADGQEGRPTQRRESSCTASQTVCHTRAARSSRR